MKTILYKDLRDEIRERTVKIENLTAQQQALLSVDEKGKVNISSENKERATQLAKAISELKRKNEIDSALLARAVDICSRYNIDLSELHQLPMLIPMYERQIDDLTEIIEEYKKTGLDKQGASPYSPFYQKEQLLKQAWLALFNHTQAKEELKAVLEARKR